MLEKLNVVLVEQCTLDKRRPVVVGVSGGPDSLCLMDLLYRSGYHIVVAHFNHRLRPEAKAEAQDVRRLAGRLKIPFAGGSANVKAYAGLHKMSIEEAARLLRYRFLFDRAHRHRAQAVAVGHTADDQVESILMHFLRGTGLTGLQGMRYRTVLPRLDAEIPIVRPLLNVWRDETRSYCEANGLQPHFDPTNESLDFLRNRIRHALIPDLETYNPNFKETVWRMSQSLAADHALLDEVVESGWRDCLVRESREWVILNPAVLSRFSVGLQRNVIRRAIAQLLPGREISFGVLERASAWVAEPARARVDLTGGLSLYREGELLCISSRETDLPFDLWPQIPPQTESVPVSLPCQTWLGGGWKFSAEKWHQPALAWEQSRKNQDPFQVWLDGENLPDRLELRSKRPGEVFEPLGLRGHSQKISDFFTNVKLPRRARQQWPLLCAGPKVVWVPGYRPAEPFKLTKSSRLVVYFSLTRSLSKNVTE